MGNPAIFSGSRTKLLTTKGLLLKDGSIIDNNGLRNYIKNSTAAVDTSGWAVYADAAGTAPVDGTGGVANVTNTRTTSSTLFDGTGFLLAKDAVNRQGQGWSYDFTVDSGSQGKTMVVMFDYIVSSGTFVAGTSSTDSDVTVWIYDVTNAQLIQPSNYKLMASSTSISTRFQANFQTAYNSTSYRLILHVGSTSASAYTLQASNFKAEMAQYTYGSPISDWISWTPTGAWSTNTTYVGKWRRVGAHMEMQINIALAGAPNSATLTVNLPSGYSIDTTALANGSNSQEAFGHVSLVTASGTTGYLGTCWYNSATSLLIKSNTSTGNYASVTQAVPGTFGATDGLSIWASVPIAGWAGNVQLSDQADVRIVDGRFYKAASQTLAPNNTAVKINLDTATKDSHGGFASNKYTVIVPGDYKVNAVIHLQSGNILANTYYAQIYKNGSLYSSGAYVTPAVTTPTACPVNDIVSCVAGDYIELYLFGAGNNSVSTLTMNAGANLSYMTIERITGPSQITAYETLAARYKTAAGQSINNNAETVVDMGTKDFDTHGSVTTGASWKFTAPQAGLYVVSAKVMFAGTTTWADAEIGALNLRKNGTQVSVLDRKDNYGSASTVYMSLQGSDSVRLLAGDYIDITVYQNSGAALALQADALHNYVNIQRTGA